MTTKLTPLISITRLQKASHIEVYAIYCSCGHWNDADSFQDAWLLLMNHINTADNTIEGQHVNLSSA